MNSQKPQFSIISFFFFFWKEHLYSSLISHHSLSLLWILSALVFCAHSLQILWHLNHASLLRLLQSVNSSTTLSTPGFTLLMGPPPWSLALTSNLLLSAITTRCKVNNMWLEIDLLLPSYGMIIDVYGFLLKS